ncbi:MAG TPA: hypothetical protein VGO40_20595 [Longimicrobium sp.]|jgi:DNA-binding HxlR family transcriptional regulator|nr:hypothetical protein [Longimicrobium sp.]
MDLGRVILGLRADAESVRGSLGLAFRALAAEATPGRREALEAFHREVVRLVMDWMARSDEASLRAVHGGILAQLAALGNDHPANRYLADDEWLGMQLRGLAVVISSYLRMDNLAKALGQLSGRRYEGWRNALLAMLREGRPMRAGELIRTGVFVLPNTADNALKQLAERGMVERRVEGAIAWYELTWMGEQVARFLESRNAPEAAELDEREARGAVPAPPRPRAAEPTASTASGGEDTVGAIGRAFAFAGS